MVPIDGWFDGLEDVFPGRARDGLTGDHSQRKTEIEWLADGIVEAQAKVLERVLKNFHMSEQTLQVGSRLTRPVTLQSGAEFPGLRGDNGQASTEGLGILGVELPSRFGEFLEEFALHLKQTQNGLIFLGVAP